ncbi:hypothetical protein Tco_1349270 [Tanacetum coccineum]
MALLLGETVAALLEAALGAAKVEGTMVGAAEVGETTAAEAAATAEMTARSDDKSGSEGGRSGGRISGARSKERSEDRSGARREDRNGDKRPARTAKSAKRDRGEPVTTICSDRANTDSVS